MVGEQHLKFRFGLAVKKRRQELNISQEELADRALLHRTYIGDIERGKRNVSLINIVKLAQALNLSVADLFATYNIEDQKCRIGP